MIKRKTRKKQTTFNSGQSTTNLEILKVANLRPRFYRQIQQIKSTCHSASIECIFVLLPIDFFISAVVEMQHCFDHNRWQHCFDHNRWRIQQKPFIDIVIGATQNTVFIYLTMITLISGKTKFYFKKLNWPKQWFVHYFKVLVLGQQYSVFVVFQI